MGASRGAVYCETRERVAALVSRLSEPELNSLLPATPAWSPRDVVGHLAGVAADVVSGNVAGRGSEPWTAAQVESRRDMPLAAVLAEWALSAERLEPLLDSGPPDVGRVVADCYLHEQDIRGGVGRPGARHADGLALSLEMAMYGLGERLDAAGLPALCLRAGASQWVAGPGAPAVTVTAPDPFELLRSLYGRRSRAQVSALQWAGEGTERYLEQFSRLPYAERDLVE